MILLNKVRKLNMKYEYKLFSTLEMEYHNFLLKKFNHLSREFILKSDEISGGL